jgi:hypothetical protein
LQGIAAAALVSRCCLRDPHLHSFVFVFHGCFLR